VKRGCASCPFAIRCRAVQPALPGRSACTRNNPGCAQTISDRYHHGGYRPFQAFNDIHGHAAGDAVLIQVANLLCTHVRASDVTCRYGGESHYHPARSLAENNANACRADAGGCKCLHVRHEGRTPEAVTLSLGVAVFPDHGSTNDAILKPPTMRCIAPNVTGATGGSCGLE